MKQNQVKIWHQPVRWSCGHQDRQVGCFQVLWFPRTCRAHKRNHWWQRTWFVLLVLNHFKINKVWKKLKCCLSLKLFTCNYLYIVDGVSVEEGGGKDQQCGAWGHWKVPTTAGQDTTSTVHQVPRHCHNYYTCGTLILKLILSLTNSSIQKHQ